MKITTMAVGPLQCNCSILADEDGATAIVVDPGGDAPAIAARLARAGLTLTHIVHTHAHVDHVGGSAELQRSCGGRAWLHEGDRFLLEMLETQCRMIGLPVPEQIVMDGALQEGARFDLGPHKLETLHTPGHTPGSCSFLLRAEGRQVLFAGDTLFRGSIGRTDLWGGDTATILASLKGKLLALDDDTEVVTGHGPRTSIGDERRGNPFLTGALRP